MSSSSIRSTAILAIVDLLEVNQCGDHAHFAGIEIDLVMPLGIIELVIQTVSRSTMNAQ
jgi:hypothetical protein